MRRISIRKAIYYLKATIEKSIKTKKGNTINMREGVIIGHDLTCNIKIWHISLP